MPTSSPAGDSTASADGRAHYLELWQYFQKRGAETKDSMVTALTWILGFAAAVLGFVVDRTFEVGGVAGFRARAPMATLTLSLAGILLCRFAHVLLVDFGRHIDAHFDDAHRVLVRAPWLWPLLCEDPSRAPEPYKGKGLASRLKRIVYLFEAAFLVAAAIGALSFSR